MSKKPWVFNSTALRQASAQAAQDRKFVVDALSKSAVATKPKRPSKYRNKPQVVDGVRFASKAEAKRDAELQLLQRADKISNLKRQPRFPLVVNGAKICTYVGDWFYIENLAPEWVQGIAKPQWQQVVEDRKGVLTPAFKIKWALAKALHPEIEWRLS